MKISIQRSELAEALSIVTKAVPSRTTLPILECVLVEVSGRSEGIGRPLIYVTTREFLKKFGFASLKDLPEVPEYERLNRHRQVAKRIASVRFTKTPRSGERGRLFNRVSYIVRIYIKESGYDQSLVTLEACMPR